MKRINLFSALLIVAAALWAQPSETYYSSANGKSGDALREALYSIIKDHTIIGYTSLPQNCYAAATSPSDFNNGNDKLLEDIYSSYPYTSSQGGASASNCGLGWNKEHTVPKSWFGSESPMYSDAFHIYPTDINMNSLRSNYPYGETDATLGCEQYGYGALGTSNRSGYSGTVFEPRETATVNYKGDLARTYFYMLTCYMETNFTQATGGAVMFTYTNNTADFTPYGLDLMMEWHREDPVSEKERIRNDAIYAHQKNRNPFIDYPCLAEYIWGNKKGETVDFSTLVLSYDAAFADTENQCGCQVSTTPIITSPRGSVAFGAVAVNTNATQTITVQGRNLTNNVTLTLSGTNANLFSLSATTVSADDAVAGKTITITYEPTSEGNHTATLTLSSTDAASVEVTLTGNGASTYTITYNAGNGTCSTPQSTELSVGAGVELPTAAPAASCTDWTFAGWSTTAVTETQTAPELLQAGDMYHPTANGVLYAVYKMTESAETVGSSNTKVTSLADGDRVVIYYPADGLALTATASGTKLTGVASTVENGSITSLGEGAVMLTVEASGDNFRLKNGDTYLICPATGNGLSFAAETDYADWTFETANDIQYVKNVNARYNNTKEQYLEYYNGFTTYGIGTTDAYKFEFYKFENVTYATSPSCQTTCTLDGIELNTANVTTAFFVGDKFTSEGLVVTALYSGCDAHIVVPTSVSTPDMSSAGTQTVTVSYTENGITKTAGYNIAVNAKPTYTITLNQNAGGTIKADVSSATAGTVVTLSATANAHYTFSEWAVLDGEANDITVTYNQFVMPASNVEVEATFVEIQYAVNTTLTHVTAANDNPTTAGVSDDDILMAFDAETGYQLPLAIEVKMGNELLTAGYDYKWTENGVLNIVHTGGITAPLYITIKATPIQYEILFLDDDNTTELAVVQVNHGEIPSYPNATPTKTSTDQYDYTFTGWSPEVVSVTGAATYTAVYAQTVRKYTVTFVDADGTELQKSDVEYGAMPTCSSPTKTSTAQYDYTFAGWSPEVVSVTGAATYTAVYTQTVRKYTVTFVDADGTELQKSDVEYGAMPTCSSPTKTSTDQYDYTFTGWSPEVVSVTGAATYTAVYAQTVRKYTVTFVDADGTELQKSDVEYGAMPTCSSPTKTSTAQYDYTFTGWSPEVVSVTGAATYTAVYAQTVRKYTVTFVDADGTELQKSDVEYGAMPTCSSPTKTSTDQYDYTFTGWSPEVVSVTGAATYTAVYTQTVRKYTVTFVDFDGTLLDEQSVEYGQAAVAPQDPTREGYTFAGWDAAFNSITANLTVTATYTKNTETPVCEVVVIDPVCYVTNDLLYVSGLPTGASLTVFDCTGRLVEQRTAATDTETFTLSNGLYLVRIQANGEQRTLKIAL